ncbi:MAG: hypothetical protein LBD89_05335 [Tannerellaceae bacterium]|jgi:hypothetical protein|nr:hypothetical protein [Tannerellaceae bacterium]
MKTLKSAFLLIVITTSVFCFNAKGQVTVGSDIAPLSGVLLDIKSKAGTAGSGDATTDVNGGGLGLPRVTLTDISSLAPFLPSASSAEKKDRTGLMVYNISTTSPFKPGVYVWDGTKWNVAGGGVKWFYMPSCNIPITTTGAKTFNLYTEYVKQFKKDGNTLWKSSNSSLAYVPSPESDRLYAATELDYVITYYDSSVITLGNTPIDANGLLTYTVNSIVTTPATYFNIVFVVK